MIFFFNAQGDTINFVPENVHQGSNNANKIYVVAPLSEANQVLAYFTLPNGNVIQPVYGSTTNGLTNLDNLQIEGKSYTVWVCNLSDIITSIAGTVTVQFDFINESQKIRTQSNEFYISEGASPYEPLDISAETTWEEILANISNFISNQENDFKNLSDQIEQKLEEVVTENEKNFNDLENDIRDQIENGLYPVNYDIATNKPIFNVELPINNPTMGYYRHVGESTDQFISGGLYYFDGVNFSLLATEKTVKEYTDKEIATVNQKIDTLHSNAFVSVNALPTASAETLGKIYLVPTANPNQANVKNEYITIEVDGNYFWEPIGSTEIDLSGKTAVTVGGVVQETWNADTKLDKVTDYEPAGLTRVYAIKYSGENYIMKTNPNAGPSTICTRDTGGRTQVNEPVKDKDASNKKYVDEAVKIYRHNIHCGNGGTEVWFTIDSKTIDTPFGNAELFALWLSDGNENKLPEFFVCKNNMDATYGYNGELYLNGTNLFIQEEDMGGINAITMSFYYAYSQQISGVPINVDMGGTFEDSVIEL